ncbi:PAS domain S-box-containing protein [Anaerovirgula multivorans]|uniref:histidine kinase n=1 Tax=Anaerovirgula multivorans TaxID=312168 RepID=A0A239E7V7_9FIRM|nr:PAS domain S-box protein [Anaerovirgula multivorans]SNS40083.1 PAS domain S-box-containing protein [Anaerovirgula multivorans]
MSYESKTREELIAELEELKQTVKNPKVMDTYSKKGRIDETLPTLYKLLFDKLPDAILLIEEKIIIDCNDTAVNMLGYHTKKELTGIKVDKLLVLKQWEKGGLFDKKGETVKEILETGISNFEGFYCRKNGETFLAEIELRLLPIEHRKIISVSLRNITEERKKELNFQDNLHMYRSFFQKNHAIMLLIDPRTANIVDANPAACSFYGYSKEEITRMKVTDISVTSHQGILNRLNNTLLHKGKHYFFKDRLSNGELRDVEVYSGIITINKKEYLYEIIFDITEKNKVIRDLIESEAKFKAVFNNASDLIFLNELTSDRIAGPYVEVNDVACKKLGYSREELLKMDPNQTDAPEKRKKIPQIAKQALEKGTITFETTAISKDRKKIPLEINSHHFSLFNKEYCLSIARDISERKMLEKKNQKLLTFLPDAVFIIHNNKIQFSNLAAVKLLGANSNKELIDKNINDFFHPDDYRNLAEAIKKTYHQNQAIPLTEAKFIRQDGSIAFVEVTGTRLLFNQQVNPIIVVRDITERKEAQRLLDETIAYDKLKTEFFANISHEIRTPINVIFGTVQLLELSLNKDLSKEYLNNVNKHIKRMKQNCYRLLRLVNNIIDITKIDSGFLQIQLQNHDIVHIINNIAISVAEYAKAKNIQLTFTSAIPSKIIACDPDKIERIMLNLLSNAIKFMKPNGEIKVSIYEKENRVVISVKDTGIGIPRNKIDTIFDRFIQVDKSLTRNHEGSGIGLSLVKSLVEMQGGNISVKSQLGKGSKFIVELPIRTLSNEENKDILPDFHDFKIDRMNIEFSDIYSNN